MTAALLAVLLALTAAAVGLLVPRTGPAGRRLVFAILGLSGVASLVAGLQGLDSATPLTTQLPLGLPWLAWNLRLDALSGVFLVLLGLVLVPVCLYGPGYTREFARGDSHPSVLHLFTGLFVAGMQLVVLADDAFVFMVAWEVMSLASYFLVAFEHQHSPNRRAAFLYLLMAHVGALAILLGFGVLSGLGDGFSFDAMRAAPQGPAWAGLAFALALAGFGTKAGLMPLHAWLPEAHPAAASHVSALMSGVMLKVAVYGFVRFAFDLLSAPHWGWGLSALLIGSVSALAGVLFALVETDLKRLLAWSSVENVGIIFVALGFSLLFSASGAPSLAALALVAALFHALNHALFKSLLFLGAGAVLHTSHQRDIESMGGLIHRMPTTALCFLVGCLSISSLPPFNGFASEWLIFQTALQVSLLESGALRALLPFVAAMLALTGALAAACFVKVFGLAFLGVARSSRAPCARGGVGHARRSGAARRVLSGVRRARGTGGERPAPGGRTAARQRSGACHRRRLAVADPGLAGGRLLLGAAGAARRGAGRGRDLADPSSAAPAAPGAPLAAVGLRLRRAGAAHAVHLGLVLDAVPAHLRTAVARAREHREAATRHARRW